MVKSTNPLNTSGDKLGHQLTTDVLDGLPDTSHYAIYTIFLLLVSAKLFYGCN